MASFTGFADELNEESSQDNTANCNTEVTGEGILFLKTVNKNEKTQLGCLTSEKCNCCSLNSFFFHR